MRKLSILVLILAVSGCSLTPPKPPMCEGEFHPVNVPEGANHE